jgi:hypothetical protein
LGERFCATAVLWHGGVVKVRFLGREIRGYADIMLGSVEGFRRRV